jgi:hypothetical protein
MLIHEVLFMLHAQNATPLPHRCRVIAVPLFFREIDRIFRVFAYYIYKNHNFD